MQNPTPQELEELGQKVDKFLSSEKGQEFMREVVQNLLDLVNLQSQQRIVIDPSFFNERMTI